MKKIFLVSGETSGDLYAAGIAAGLQRLAAADGDGLELSGMGGERSREAGIKLLVDSTELGVMGVVEVFTHIFSIASAFRKLVRAAEAERPDAVILIDYPGFNLELAKALWKRRIPVIWFVSPQVWTWKKYRIRKLEKYCSRMLVIFPFETEVYAPTALPTEFVGHPLLDIVAARRDPSLARDPDLVLLLPGSRFMEITRLLTPMLETVRELAFRHPALRFELAAPREKIANKCAEIIAAFRHRRPDMPEIKITVGQTSRGQQTAIAGLAASGTVTVESAIAGLPLVVVYKMNLITILIAAVLVRLYRGFFTMVNVILNRCVFEEFLQYEVRPSNLVPALERILPGGARRSEVEAGMDELRRDLSVNGKTDALANAAASVYGFIKGNQNDVR
ncbi:MAG: lipid-A-disaccharide synthase [Victivallaceae bacterium]|nr:lipid-A-disaccharide synthase [Victivallaceae bacterium]